MIMIKKIKLWWFYLTEDQKHELRESFLFLTAIFLIALMFYCIIRYVTNYIPEI